MINEKFVGNLHDFKYVDFVEGVVPVDFWKIRSEIKKNPILNKILDYIVRGWSKRVKNESKPYLLKKDELHIERCYYVGVLSSYIKYFKRVIIKRNT